MIGHPIWASGDAKRRGEKHPAPRHLSDGVVVERVGVLETAYASLQGLPDCWRITRVSHDVPAPLFGSAHDGSHFVEGHFSALERLALARNPTRYEDLHVVGACGELLSSCMQEPVVAVGV